MKYLASELWSCHHPGCIVVCGTPFICHDQRGVGELVVGGQTSWLITPGNDEVLKAGISYVSGYLEVVASMRPHVRGMAEARISPAVVEVALRKCFSTKGGSHD